MHVGIDCWKWIVAVNVIAQNSCSIHLFVLSALRQEFLFPWKGLAGESVRPGSPSSVQNSFTVFLELISSLLVGVMLMLRSP